MYAPDKNTLPGKEGAALHNLMLNDKNNRTPLRMLAAAGMTLAWAAALAQAGPGQGTPGANAGTEGESSAKADARANAGDSRIEEILGRLEKRGDGLDDIHCHLVLVDEDTMEMSKSRRTGMIKFMMAEPNPLWLVHFEKNIVDGSRWGQQWYLFDGRWLLEAQERLKQVTRYEYVESGAKVDFFDLDKAPFPLPFGQKREKILKHFDVTLAPPGKSDPDETDHLVCKPKKDSRHAETYDRLEFFVRRGLDLPVRVVMVKKGGYQVRTADFPDLQEASINTGLSRGSFEQPKAWEGYKLIDGDAN